MNGSDWETEHRRAMKFRTRAEWIVRGISFALLALLILLYTKCSG